MHETRCQLHHNLSKLPREGEECHYFGETAKTSFDRGLEHLAAIRAKNKESPMAEHALKEHEGEEMRFSMKVKGYFTRPLEGQGEKASKIDALNGRMMNRRGEWGLKVLPKLCIEYGTAEQTGQKVFRTSR